MIRTRNLLTTLVLLGGLGLSLLATPAAQAGLIPNQVTVTPTTGGNYTWSYNVVVTSDVYVQPGDYFTIYDFAGAVPGSATGPAGWTLTTQNAGTTPPKTNPADDPNIPNYTWTYTGATTIFGSALLGTFSLTAPSNHVAQSDFTSQTHRQDNNNPEYNITETTVPVAAAGSKTPEPATLALAVAGLPIVGFFRRRRKS
jgi:PEP-CTERM motif